MDKLTQERQARILGLDVLRILSMVMIVGLHLLGQGGILEAAELGSGAWYASRCLQCLFYCAVDCYGLLSGYVGTCRGRNGPRLLILWLTVVLYSCLFVLFFRWRSPELVGKDAFIHALFPVLTRQYWYFTAYFGMSLLLSRMEGASAVLTGGRGVRSFAALTVFFCLLPTLLHSDPFHMRGGYSLIWLTVLYLMGAALRRDRFFQRLGSGILVLSGLICLILTYASILKPMTFPYFGDFTLLNYTSPTITVFAGCLVLLLGRIRGKRGKGACIVTGLARSSFSVYILHTNPLLWWLAFRPGCLQQWAVWPAWKLVLAVPAASAAVYLVCALADRFRILAFRALRMRELAEGLFDRIFPPEN